MKESNSTVILFTGKGIVALDSPVKLKILEILKKGAMSFDELVDGTGRAKSTISVHLNDLERGELIEEKSDPSDKRKKYFVLNSQYVAYSQEPICNYYNTMLEHLDNAVNNEYEFLKCLFHTVRFGMEAYGVNPRPMMKRMGKDIGGCIGGHLKSNNLNDLLPEIADFWKIHLMGKMTVIECKPIKIKVEDCFDCGYMPNVGKTLCSLDEGILEGIIATRLKTPCCVREVECFGTGYDHCTFVINSV